MEDFESIVDDYCNLIEDYECFQIYDLKVDEQTFRDEFISRVCQKLNALQVPLNQNLELSDDAFVAKIKLQEVYYLIECVFINTSPDLEIDIYTKISSE
jgi:hypothetical protein